MVSPVVCPPAPTVEEALERNPLVNVANCWEVKPPEIVSVPSWAACEKRFVELAVVEKRLVVVPFAREKFNPVMRPALSILKSEVVADAVELAISNRREFVSPLLA